MPAVLLVEENHAQRTIFVSEPSVHLELIPKLQLAAPLLDTNGLTLRWTGGAGTRLQQTLSLQSASWGDVDNSEGQSRIQVPRSAASQFFRVVQR